MIILRKEDTGNRERILTLTVHRKFNTCFDHSNEIQSCLCLWRARWLSFYGLYKMFIYYIRYLWYSLANSWVLYFLDPHHLAVPMDVILQNFSWNMEWNCDITLNAILKFKYKICETISLPLGKKFIFLERTEYSNHMMYPILRISTKQL